MSKYTIGVDVGGTNVKLGLVRSDGVIVRRSRISTKQFPGKQKLIQALVRAIAELIAAQGLSKKMIQGIGVGLPGLIDPVQGMVFFLPNVPGWRKVPLKKILEKELKIPTFMDNDVNVITLAEWRYGAGKGCDHLICMTLGTGVGGGLILDGRLYRGAGYVAGEIGHIPFENKTLEEFVGNGPLLKQARKIFKKERIQLEDIHCLAAAGNPRALKFWRTAGERIGVTLAGVINVLNPKLIIIGGGVSNNFRYLKDSIQETLKARAMEVQSKMVKIVRAKLGDDAGILGGQILVNLMRRRNSR